MDFVSHAKDSIDKANAGRSKITPGILAIDGMTGVATRHFYNNICNFTDARYLEIGSWKGSSICSAMCGNEIKCVCIDDWSQWSDAKTRAEFLKNHAGFRGINDARFIEKTCWDVNLSEIGPFNVYLYDGRHTVEDQRRALVHFLPCLDEEFIFIVDDWNSPPVQDGTEKALAETKVTVKFRRELFTTGNDSRNPWHNGCAVFVLEKPRAA